MNTYLHEFVDKKFTKSGKALDLGAGDGQNIKLLTRLGWLCKGIDMITGTNLNKIYQDPAGPVFNLVFSTYVIHKLQYPSNLLKTAFANLKKKGWFFLQTFDESDNISTSKFNRKSLEEMLREEGFSNIQTNVYELYDDDDGHKHIHKVLEATAQK